MTDATADGHTTTPPRSAGFWLGLVIGSAVIAYGVADLLHQSRTTNPAGLATWFGGAGVAHDAIIAPIAVGVGWATRRLSVAARVPVRLGLAASALLTLLVWPLVQGWGRSNALPSALPLAYGHNLVGALLAIWIAVAAATVVGLHRS